MEKNPKSESYIIKEAENIIENYLREREEDYNNSCYKQKYERLKILSITLAIISSVGILISLFI